MSITPNFEEYFKEEDVLIDLNLKQDKLFMKSFHDVVKAYQILS
jgi:hypothetical protein